MARLSYFLFAAGLSCVSVSPAIAQDGAAEAAAEPAAAEEPKPAEAAPAPPPASSDTVDLAKQAANPIANLISIPFQQEFDFGSGLDNKGVQGSLTLLPLIPISLNAKDNLLSRTIVPIIWQNAEISGEKQFGLGDTLQSFFYSPKLPTKGGIVWGVGPALLLPTATDPVLGQGKWGIGPTFVVLKQPGNWTLGFLANHIWSIAGKNDRLDISATFLEPFVTYTWPNSVGLNLYTETTYDWEAKQWTVPVILGVSKIIQLGKQAASIEVDGLYFAERPAFGPNWGLRTTFTLLFPEKPKP